MTTLPQPIFCHCDLSFGEHKTDKSFDGTIPFGLWIGVCFLIVLAVVAVVMGVAVYKEHIGLGTEIGANRMLWRTGSGEQSARPSPVKDDDFTLDTRPSNPVIECRGGKC